LLAIAESAARMDEGTPASRGRILDRRELTRYPQMR
jgi:hypothetical protein